MGCSAGGREWEVARWRETSSDYNYAFGDVSATWTGQGKVSNTVRNYKDGSPGEAMTVIDHNHGMSRPAAATGIVAGLTFSASDLVEGQIGNAKPQSTV